MILLVLILTTITSGIVYVQWVYGYWRRRAVIFKPPIFPFGSLMHLFTKKKYIGNIYESDYNYIVSNGHRYGGIFNFTSPALLVVDPDLIKDILTKDFCYFNDRGFYSNDKHDPLSAHLLNLTGDKWKTMRKKLTGAFTTAKVKTMFDAVLNCTQQLLSALDEYVAKKVSFDADEVMAKFTTDVIGSCAFGLECNSFTESHCAFRKHGDEIMRPPLWKVLLLALGEMNKELANYLGVTRTTAAVRMFFISIVSDTLAYRAKSRFVRKDFIQILMDLKNENQGLTLNELTAQALLFFVAGFETSASTLTFCLYELAKHPDIQDRLRNEINGDISYESLNEMSYLGQVIDEVLRKYPPAGVVARKCLKDYRLRGTNLTVKRGIKVLISIQGLHHDCRYYSNPDNFDPERFNKVNRKSIRPFTYLPFGEGPRSCIGAKFGIMQTKIGLITMLKRFKFTLNAKTPKVLKPYYGSISLTFPKSVWVDVEVL